MTSINEVGLKLIPIINIALTVLNKENQLNPIQQVVHNLQMSIYWLKTAYQDLKEYTKDAVTTDNESIDTTTIPIPTLFSTQDQLNFIKTSLEDLTKGLDQVSESLSSVPSVQYKVQRGMDKLYEGLFNNDLAINYYQQLTNGRTRK